MMLTVLSEALGIPLLDRGALNKCLQNDDACLLEHS